MTRIPFIDLRPGEDAAQVRTAIDRVIDRGWFVLGPEVEAFESEFAAAAGARHAVGVSTGTDAIALLLRATGIQPGDEVIVPAMTAAYTGLAVLMAGALPVFADVEPETLALDPQAAAAAVTGRTHAIIPVHLYGQAADVEALLAMAARHRLVVIEDCCQAHGATCQGVPVGTRSAGAAYSFYPTKNLGALGDAGAAVTNDGTIADRLRRLRNGGQTDRYHHVEFGTNSRLDEMQAAVLRAKLPGLASATNARRALASEYRRRLPATVATIPERDPGHVYHLFPIRSAERDALQEHLRASSIETLIHYPVPLPAQPAFAQAGRPPADCPNAARAARELLSLPLHPRLAPSAVARVAEAIDLFETGHVRA